MASDGFNQNQTTLVAVTTVCLVIAIATVGLRLFARRLTGSKLWWDDWCVVLALIFSAITDVFIYISVKAGLGQHMTELTPKDLTLFGLMFWLQELSWTFAMVFIVWSILFFYKRLFASNNLRSWMRRAIFAVGGLNICWAVVTLLVCTFQCKPVPYFWDRTIPGGTCIDASIWYFINGILNISTILLVLVLPVPVLWNLQISKSKRAGLIFSFTVGTFVCSISIARLIAIRNIDSSDMSWSTLFTGMWSCVEANIGIASACIPSLTPIFYRNGSNKQSSKYPLGSNIHVTDDITLTHATCIDPSVNDSGSVKGLAAHERVSNECQIRAWA